jgi:hypothetical protein
MPRFLPVSRALWWLALALCVLPLGQAAAEAYRFPAVERVVAVGDVHGALDEFVATLRGAGLVDEELSWSGGTAHLVSIGDLLDRGDHGRQAMDLLMRLEAEAAAAGGAVHLLLGNHEAMNLSGDLRYVSAGDYAQFGTEALPGLPEGFLERRAAFAPDGEYGRWLLGKPVAIVIGDTLFVHAGLSPKLAGLSLAQINETSQRDLRRFAKGWHALLAAGQLVATDDFDAIRARAAELAANAVDERLRGIGAEMTAALDGLPFQPDGPLWYRGSARCHAFAETQVTEEVLHSLDARRVVIGHTLTGERRITRRKEGRVLRIDTGMNTAAYQGRPAALIIENGTARAWYAGEGLVDIGTEPSRAWERPFGMSDAELEAFLLAADVVQTAPLAGSSDRRRLVTLQLDGRQLKAVFNARDTMPGLQSGRWTRRAENADRYLHEVAAYRLDRIMDLQLVPVTVARKLGDESGALRLWIEPGFSEHERATRRISFSGDCDLAAQYALMGVFDALIFNPTPQLGLLRYDRWWTVWLMDQSRAFGTASDVDAMLRRSGLRPTAQMAAALAQLTPEAVESLAEYLHPRQVAALVDRAARLRARH